MLILVNSNKGNPDGSSDPLQLEQLKQLWLEVTFQIPEALIFCTLLQRL
jgi:hypothetical protein